MMKMAIRSRCTALLLLAACGSGASLAQTAPQSTTIYRCGPEGRELRGSPCPVEAKASVQSLQYDQPAAAQIAEARQRAAQEAKQAAAMEKARLKQEAEQRRHAAPATGIHGHRGEAPARAASAAAAKQQPSKPKPPQKPKPPKLPKAPRTHDQGH